jgi:hypothetical protein
MSIGLSPEYLTLDVSIKTIEPSTLISVFLDKYLGHIIFIGSCGTLGGEVIMGNARSLSHYGDLCDRKFFF